MGQMMIKDSGVWKKVKTPMIKVGGVWKPAKKVFMKVAGVWKEVYSSGFWGSDTTIKLVATMRSAKPGAPYVTMLGKGNDGSLTKPGIPAWRGTAYNVPQMNVQYGYISRIHIMSDTFRYVTAFSSNYNGLNATALMNKFVADWNANKIGFYIEYGTSKWLFNASSTGYRAFANPATGGPGHEYDSVRIETPTAVTPGSGVGALADAIAKVTGDGDRTFNVRWVDL